MAKKQLSPIDELLRQKSLLQHQCHEQEEAIKQQWQYFRNNAVSITTKSAIQAINPFSSSEEENSASSGIGGSIMRFIPSGIMMFVTKKIASMLMSRSEKKEGGKKKERNISDSLKILLGVKSALIFPVLTLTWAMSRPFIFRSIQKKLDNWASFRETKKGKK